MLHACKLRINLIINNFSENRVTSSNGGMTFYWLYSCLRSERGMYKVGVMIYYKALWHRILKYIINVRNLSLHKLISVNVTMFDGGHDNSALMTKKLVPCQDSNWLPSEHKSATWELLHFICYLSNSFQISAEICSSVPTALQQDVH